MDETLASELIERLKTIHCDNDFIEGVLSFCSTDGNMRRMIQLLDSGELVTSDEILLYAAIICPNMEFIEKG